MGAKQENEILSRMERRETYSAVQIMLTEKDKERRMERDV